MRHPIFAIAYVTWLDALRSLRVAVPTLLLIFALSFFLRELAISEAVRIQTIFLGAGARLILIFILSLFIIVSVVREFNDKSLALILALDFRRSSYVLGKFVGFFGVGLVFALFGAVLLGASTGPEALIAWASSLFLELTLLAALSIFAAIAFTSVLPAVSLVWGFYILARSITALQLMSTGPLASEGSMQTFLSAGINGIAYLIPRLSEYAQTAWLVNGAPPTPELFYLFVQTFIFSALLLAGAAFDFQRKEF